jgi:hypothetical protein
VVWIEIGCESLERWAADASSIWRQQNVDKLGWLLDIAAESDLIDGVVPGDKLTVSYGGSLNSSADIE